MEPDGTKVSSGLVLKAWGERHWFRRICWRSEGLANLFQDAHDTDIIPVDLAENRLKMWNADSAESTSDASEEEAPEH